MGKSRKIEISIIFLISFLFCLAIALSPSVDVVPWVSSKFDGKRILEVVLVGVVLLYAVFNGKGLYGYGYSILILLFLLVISAFLSSNLIYAFLEASLFVGLFFCADFIRQGWCRFENNTVILVFGAVSLSAFLFVVTVSAGYLAIWIEAAPLVKTTPYFGFLNVRFFNQYQVWLLPLLAIPLVLEIPVLNRFKKLLLVVLVSWWALLFLTAGRGALIAVVISMIATLIVFRREAIPFFKKQVLAAVLGFTGYVFLWFFLYDTGGASLLRTTGQGRLQLWSDAIELVRINPFFGVGPMHYASYQNDIANHPHNSVLQIAAEWGLPATILVLFIFFYGLACWIKRFNYKTATEKQSHKTNMLAIALFCSLIAGAVYSLVSGVIVMPLSQLLGVVVVGMMLGLYRGRDKEGEVGLVNNASPRSVVEIVLSRVLAGITLVVFVWSLMPSLLPLITNPKESFSATFQLHNGPAKPRFWTNGDILHSGGAKRIN